MANFTDINEVLLQIKAQHSCYDEKQPTVLGLSLCSLSVHLSFVRFVPRVCLGNVCVTTTEPPVPVLYVSNCKPPVSVLYVSDCVTSTELLFLYVSVQQQ